MGDDQTNTYVFGTSFLSSQVSIFDLDNKKIGFQPLDDVSPNKLKPWMIALIAVGGLLIILVVVLVICKVAKNKKEKMTV